MYIGRTEEEEEGERRGVKKNHYMITRKGIITWVSSPISPKIYI